MDYIAQAGILVSLMVCWGLASCSQWREKGIYLCAWVKSMRRKTLSPRYPFEPACCGRVASGRHTSELSGCPPLVARISDIPHTSMFLIFFTELCCKCLFIYCQHRSFFILHPSQTLLITVTGPFRDISWCVISKMFSSLISTREDCLRATHLLSHYASVYKREDVKKGSSQLLPLFYTPLMSSPKCSTRH